jgi:putative membrane protein
MGFLMRVVISAVNVFVLAYILPGVNVNDFFTALIVALVLALLDSIVKPLLLIFTLPVTILTLGLFIFVINALIILLGTYLVKGFVVDGFWWALLFSLLLSFFNSFVASRVGSRDSNKRK